MKSGRDWTAASSEAFYSMNSAAYISAVGKAGRGNSQKYVSYSAAWARIRSAREKGFNLEAIIILESIIADRLLSHVNGKYALNLKPECHLGQIIKQAIKLMEKAGDDISILLLKEVDKWRTRRNAAAHAIVKSIPGTAPMEINTFLSEAEKTAQDGIKLAIEVTNWHKQHLRIYKKSLNRKPR